MKSKLFTDTYQTGLLKMRLGWNPVSTDPATQTKCFSLSDIADTLLPRRIRIKNTLFWLSCAAVAEDEDVRWDVRYETIEADDWAFESQAGNLIDALVELALSLHEYSNEFTC